MKNLFCVILIFFSTFYASGQNSFGPSVSAGSSLISHSFYKDIDDTRPIPGFCYSGGLYYSRNFGKHYLDAAIQFSQTKGSWEYNFVYTDVTGNILGSSKSYYHLSFSNLQIPIFYGYKFNKFKLSLGLALSYNVKSDGYFDLTHLNLSTGALETTTTDPETLDVDDFNLDLPFQVEYHLTSRLTLTASYYFGLNNLISNDIETDYVWRRHQLSFGARFNLLKN